MTDLNELFFKIQDARKREALPPPSTKLLARLQKALTKNGATTGDPIRDHVIKHWSADEAVETYIRDLQTNLKGKTGQLCLFVHVTRTWNPRERGFRTEVELHMFRPDNEHIGLDDQFWIFKTAQASSLKLNDSDVIAAVIAASKSVQPLSGSLYIKWKWLARFLPHPLNRHHREEHDHGERKFDLICGDEEVKTWFEVRMRFVEVGFSSDLWAQACHALAVACGCPEDKLPKLQDPFEL